MPSVLADFVAYLTAETASWDGPIEGRVLLSENQLVLAKNEDERETINLNRIFDINIGTKPTFIDAMPGTPVTIAFRSGQRRVTAVVGADDTAAEKFRTVLFKAILNGTYTTIKHPAKVGGRVMDTAYEAAILGLESGGVTFETDEGPLEVPLDGVIDYSRQERTIDGVDQPVLVVSHMQDGEALETEAATDSNRKLALLGRYLQRTYQTILQSLRQLSLSEMETEALTTIYSIGDADISLPSVLDEEPKRVRQILQALHGKGLIESGEHGPVLTAKGQIVVNEYLERVNA